MEVIENGITFGFDITRVMFCSGNCTERMRMGREAVRGQVVVDLYCGVGYYTLPFLVHGEVRSGCRQATLVIILTLILALTLIITRRAFPPPQSSPSPLLPTPPEFLTLTTRPNSPSPTGKTHPRV